MNLDECSEYCRAHCRRRDRILIALTVLAVGVVTALEYL